MSGQPRRNEDRFYRYPMHRVVAIIDDESQVDAALDHLGRAGVEVTGVNVLSGPQGARLLDRSGTGHGLRARLVRLAQRGAYEIDVLRAHERALNDGHHVIYVPVRGDNERRKVVDILRAAGGHYLLHFRAWSIEEFLT
jgi:hypothetical protein